MASFIDLVLKNHPTHVAVAFDRHEPTFRHEIFPEYKANRDAQPEDIQAAVPLVRRFIEAMRIREVSLAGYEADDVVGTLAVRFAAEGAEVVMVTPDKDYAQIVRPGVTMLRPRTGGAPELMDVAAVCEHFGVERPEQVIDLLGLWGDSSDNYPGCPGVGEKRAKELIATFGSIDEIYARSAEIKGKMRENIENNREIVMLSRKLATIVTDAPVEVSLDDIALADPDWEALDALFGEMEFRGVSDRIRQALGIDVPLKPSKKNDAQPSLFDVLAPEDQPKATSELQSAATVPHTYKSVTTVEELDALCRTLLAADAFCFDTETDSVESAVCNIVGFSVSVKSGEAYYAPMPSDHASATSLLSHVAQAFADERIVKIGQNMKFDIMVLRRYGIDVRGPRFDTMIAHFLLHPGRRHNMDDMAEELLAYKTIHIEELIGKGAKQISMDRVPLEKITEYAAEDADVTLRLYAALRPQLEAKPELLKIFSEMEMPLVDVLTDMELAGVSIDTDALAAYSADLRKMIAESEAKIVEMAGENFNIASPKQVGDILFDKLKIDPEAKRTKTGNYATGEEILQKLSHAHPIVAEILNYRGLVKLLGTYAEALPKLVAPSTGRIHTSYNQAVAVTGRLSSSNPNLQNIPIRDANGKRIRECFVARPGCKIVAVDYSQVELRLMAHFSGDERLLEAFRAGEDIHKATAAKVFGVELPDVTSDMRRKAKTANFGIIYGISAFGLAEQLDISRKEAKDLIDGYFQNFPGVRSYMDRCVEEARKSGVVSTLFGRIRELPDIASRNAVVRGMAERNAINAPIQGTAADIMKLAMISVHNELKARALQSRLILQVHDEIVLEVPEAEVPEVCQMVKEKMEQAAQLSIPLTAEVGVGDNWLQAH